VTEKLSRLEDARRESQIQQRFLFEIEEKESLQQELSQYQQRAEDIRAELQRPRSSGRGRAEQRAEVRVMREAESRLAAIEDEAIKLRPAVSVRVNSSISQTEEGRFAGSGSGYADRNAHDHRSQGIAGRMIARYEGYGSGVAAVFAEREQLAGLRYCGKSDQDEENICLRLKRHCWRAANYRRNRSRAADRAISYLKENNLGRRLLSLLGVARWSRDYKLARRRVWSQYPRARSCDSCR